MANSFEKKHSFEVIDDIYNRKKKEIDKNLTELYDILKIYIPSFDALSKRSCLWMLAGAICVACATFLNDRDLATGACKNDLRGLRSIPERPRDIRRLDFATVTQIQGVGCANAL